RLPALPRRPRPRPRGRAPAAPPPAGGSAAAIPAASGMGMRRRSRSATSPLRSLEVAERDEPPPELVLLAGSACRRLAGESRERRCVAALGSRSDDLAG